MKPPLYGSLSTLRILLIVVLLSAATVPTYFTILNAPFVFDDLPNITGNPRIRITALSAGQIAGAAGWPSPLRSVAYLSFGLNYYFGGYDPFGYHLFNIVVHVTSALLLFLIAAHTLDLVRIKKGLIPEITALLWILHPLHIQSVTYIVQRMNALAVMFFLLSLYLYIRARNSGRINGCGRVGTVFLFAGCAGSGLLAVFSKEIAATLPIVLCLYEWYFFQNLSPIRLNRRVKWLVTAAAAGAIITVAFFADTVLNIIVKSYSEQTFSPLQRILTEPRVIVYYLSLLFFPHPARLTIDYDFPLAASGGAPGTTILALTAIATLIAAVFYKPQRHRLLSFTLLWFLGNLVIESSVIGLAIIFEHRTYLPSIFPVFLFVTLILRKTPRPVSAGVISLIFVICLTWTSQRNTVWKETLILWQDCARKTPRQARPANGVGLAYQAQNQPEKALAWFQKAVDLDPDYDEAYSNVGGILVNLGRVADAVPYLERAIAINPESHVAFSNLGSAMKRLNRLDEAIACYRKSISLYPDYETAHNNLGAVLTEKGDFEGAVGHLQRAIQINPNYHEPYSNLGLAMMQEGRIKEAIACYRKALALKPDYATAHFNLGTACFQIGDLKCARRHLEQAARFTPDPVLALNNLAAVLVLQKKYDLAIAALIRLTAIRPESATVYYNLACVYALNNKTEDAVRALKQAVTLGYDRWENMKKDPDLENIHHTDYYKSLLR